MLFGDSSLIIGYLKLVGYKLNKVEQTGSNFGTSQKHENPFLCDIGSGTMVSDGLSMMNVQMSTTSFRVRKVKIGDQNYLGNNIHYPPDGRTGANCLFGTKTMVPVDGPVRENVGLLGSPCFEIPRVNERDQNFEAAMSDELKRERLAGKNKHNIGTIALYLGCYWTVFFVTLLSGAVAVLNYPTYGLAALIGGGAFAAVFAFAFLVLMERAAIGFGQLEPKIASTYDPYFWYHERHWKLCDATLTSLFKGTPFKNWISRLTGVHVGKMVFDDGCEFVEKSLITIGDYTNLNEAALLQGHTLEEGVFKSDRIAIGRGCSIGAAVLVNYGVKMGDNSVLGPDSFLMKGEVVEANATWCGNPARAVRTKAVSVPAASGDAPEVSLAAAA
jgi:non-ribosomal peptide synthetase-like protein